MNTEQELLDIYGVWHVPFWQRPWFYWGVYSLIALFMIATTWVIIQKYRLRKNNVTEQAWQKALRLLVALQQANVATIEQGEKFYAQLTTILKQYLHDRYQFDLLGKTDREVIDFLEKQQFDPDVLNQLRGIFEGSTYIKFANVQAMQEQLEADFEHSIALIKQTTPIEE